MSRIQLPLALKPPRRPRFDNFIVGDNRAVVATLTDGLDTGSWTFLGGPGGSGRTHLLSALFAERCRRGTRALFIALREPNQRPLLDQALADWIVLDDVEIGRASC